ncbi:hypothetical protein [Staphylococcus succinus]|uniref:hypothetical protein n=1 Tax=Staphylococcus succinus TaxID=61015 RepID=UPI001C05545A|nr:hypothetical protein [Staphylococcus succinus]MBU0439344.1 hypothetical protein [Staphylococcus succinus]
MLHENIKQYIEVVINSGISFKKIAKETEITVDILKNIKSNCKNIESIQYADLIKILKFYENHKEELELYKNIPEEIKLQQIPEKVKKYIFGIDQAFNHDQIIRPSEISLCEKYNVNDEGNLLNEDKFLEANVFKTLTIEDNFHSLDLKVKSPLPINKSLSDIKNVKIIFKKEELELTIKKYIQKGYRIRLLDMDIMKDFESNGIVAYSPNNLMEKLLKPQLELDYFSIVYQ